MSVATRGREPYSLTPSGIFPAAAVYSQEKERGRERRGGRKRDCGEFPERGLRKPPKCRQRSDEKMAWESERPISQGERETTGKRAGEF